MYQIEKTWDRGLRLGLEKQHVWKHRLVLSSAVLFLIAAPILFLAGETRTATTLLGCGIAVLGGGFFLYEFHRARPAAFVFDHAAGRLIVEERDGDRAGFGYEGFNGIRLRRQNRRWVVYLNARDGSYLDLSAPRSRRRAIDLIQRLGTLPNVTATREPAESAPIKHVREQSEIDRQLFLWKDSLTPRGTLYLAGLLAGIGLAAYGFAAEEFQDPLVAGFLPGFLAILLVYLLYSIARSIGQLQAIVVDARGIAWGTARERGGKFRVREIERFPREKWTGLWFSFDCQAGLHRFLLPDSATREAMAGLYGGENADFRAAWRGLRARLRTPQITLPGLTTADAVRLRAKVARALEADV